MFPFSRSTPESAPRPSATPTEANSFHNRHPRGGGPAYGGITGDRNEDPTSSAILNEAILASSSSVRDSLPEQHRTHFETLRQEIIDFAKAHDIPRESLAKPDTLREAANKLSILDLQRLATLLERFEHLLVHKEPREEIPGALEYAEKFYYLEKQYTSQVELLEQVGILKEGMITGIDGNEYPIPTLEQITCRLFERRETLETKHDQGFTKLLLVPFGMSLDALISTFKQFLLDHKKNNSTFDLDIDNPLYNNLDYQGADMGDSPKLVYYPKSFDRENHQGKTKIQVLKEQEDGQDSFPGWTIHLLQPSNLDTKDTETPAGFAPIPRQGQETSQENLTPRPPFRERGDRPPLRAGQSSDKSLLLLQNAQDDKNSPYHGETGLTPEDWIMAFILHLQETGELLDNYSSDTESCSDLIGTFFPSSALVPCAYWRGDFRQVRLGGGFHNSSSANFGVRSSVMI